MNVAMKFYFLQVDGGVNYGCLLSIKNITLQWEWKRTGG